MLKRLFNKQSSLLNWLIETKPKPAVRTKVKPRMEVLEDRFIPATRIWDGGALSNNWSNATNWASNIAPVAGDDLVFPANVSDKTADNNYAAGTFFNSITLGGGYTLRGNRVNLGAGGIVDNSSTSDIIKLDIALGSSGTGARTFQIGTGSTLFVDGEISGTLGVIKAGTGNLSFRANNSYGGQTQVNAGILFVEKDESLGTLNNVTVVRTGATLLANDTALGKLRIDEPIFLEEGAILRAVNDVEVSGPMTLVGTATFKHESSFGVDKLDVTGRIVGAGGVNIAAGGRVAFSGTQPSQYEGATTVAGKLFLDRSLTQSIPGDLFVLNGGVVEFQQESQIAHTSRLHVTGTGQVMLNSLDQTIRSLIMNGGTLDAGIPFGGYGLLTVEDEIRVSSYSSLISARLEEILLATSTSTQVVVQVNDGPAFNDLYFQGVFIGGLRKEGAGVLFSNSDLLDPDPVTYVINEGLFRYENEGYEVINIIVNEWGRLSSDGYIDSLVVNAGGRVRPGPLNSTGILKIARDLTLNPGAILEVTFNGSIAGSDHDQIDVFGNVFINGSILEPTLGVNVSTGSQFRIIDNRQSDGIVGSFQIPTGSAPFLLATPTGQRLSISNTAGLLSNDVVVTLENTPPRAPDLALNRTTLDEGGLVTATGHLVDPDGRDRLKLYVNWGDGSRQEVYQPGLKSFRLTHRYHDDGEYVSRFEWLDQHGHGNSRSFNVSVNNVAPRIQLNQLRLLGRSLLLTHGLFDDAGRDAVSVSVDYGDGSPIRQLALHRKNHFWLKHRYQQPGAYSVTVSACDKDGGVSTVSRTITV